MSSIRLFKKEINNYRELYRGVYAWELNHPDADPKSLSN